MKARKIRPTTTAEIEQLIAKKYARLSMYNKVAYYECYVGYYKRFTWFTDDDSVYLYTLNKRLQHVGYATNKEQFAETIKTYLGREDSTIAEANHN